MTGRGLDLDDKLGRLKEVLAGMKAAVIAYSGGVDSTFLADIAHEVLGNNALIVFAYSPVGPSGESVGAETLAKQRDFRFLKIESHEMANPEFAANTPNRCYYCKQELFQKLRKIANRENIAWIADGSNYDDRLDYRPGRRAAAELQIRSPLSEVGLTKQEIRKLSLQRRLPTWDKPASPCLASRIPYGTPVTAEIIGKIAAGENYLRSLGIRELRLRHHGNIARIEVDERGMAILFDNRVRQETAAKLKSLGYSYITLDLAGYRTGSLNEILPEQTSTAGTTGEK